MKLSAFILLIAVAAGFIACKKGYDELVTTTPDVGLNVVNGTLDTLNFYLNGTRQNNTSSIYPGGSSGYLDVYPGNQNYQFKKYLQNTVLFSKSLNLKDSTYNSLFIGGETVDKCFTTADTLISVSDSSRVRFVHTAENAPALDVMIDAGNGFTNRSFKSVSPFKSFSSGLKTINVYLAGGTVVQASQKITLTQGSIYTLYVRGVPGGTGKSALTLDIFTNQ